MLMSRIALHHNNNMTLKLFVAVMIVCSAFKTVSAVSVYVPVPQALPANDARDIIMDQIRSNNMKAIDWWVDFINTRVIGESQSKNASTNIDITKAGMEVQEYLVLAYERAGY